MVPSAKASVGEHALHLGQDVAAEMAVADANPDIDLERHVDRGADIEIIARELEAGEMRLDQQCEEGLEFGSTARQAMQIRLIDGVDRDEHRVPAAGPAETRLGRGDIGMPQRHLLPVVFGDGAELDGAERFRRDLAHLLDGLGLGTPHAASGCQMRAIGGMTTPGSTRWTSVPQPALPISPMEMAMWAGERSSIWSIQASTYLPSRAYGSRSPATGGEEPETIEHVRQIAPEAFRALQFRAVTERDWEEMALRDPDVAAAKASFRWTGSWHTVFVAIHPVDRANLRRLPGGGTELQPDFAAQIKAYLTRFKLAGYDLDIRAAIYVPLEIDIRICVGDGHFRGDVLAEVQRVLSNRSFRRRHHRLSSSRCASVSERPSISSQLYAAVSAVEGVNSAEITTVQALLGSAARRTRKRRHRDDAHLKSRASITTGISPRMACCASRAVGGL